MLLIRILPNQIAPRGLWLASKWPATKLWGQLGLAWVLLLPRAVWCWNLLHPICHTVKLR